MQSEVIIERLKQVCDQGQLPEILDCLGTVCNTVCCNPSSLYARLPHGCHRHGTPAGAAVIHSVIARSGIDSDADAGTYLVRLYASSGRLGEASKVFEKIHEPNVLSWSAIIAAHSKFGHHDRALELYAKMRQSNLDADGHLYVEIVKASASSNSIQIGKAVHSHVVEGGYECDAFVCNALMSMYAKCGSLTDAQSIFQSSPKLDVVAWNTIIIGLVEHGYENEALSCFQQMLTVGPLTTEVTFVCVLKACSNLVNVDAGMLAHIFVIEAGHESDCRVSNTLIDLYLRCGTSLDALALFKQRAKRNIVTWNIMVSGLAQQGHYVQALDCWFDMLKEGWKPDRIAFCCSLQACVNLGALHEGKLIHILMLEFGINLNTSVSNALVDVYCTCGALDDGCKVFSGSSKQDAVAWNMILKGMAQQGCHQNALHLFQQMQLEGVLATRILDGDPAYP